MLLPHGSVHPALHLVSDCLQLSDQALGLRLPLDREPVRPGLAAVVREAQKVEGLRASPPSGGSVAGGGPPELNQPGLALVERQAELLQPVLEVREELLPIRLELTAEHQSSSGGEFHPSALREPDVRLA